MTKQQAYILARKELWHKAVTAKEVKARAMEIFAAAFGEWTGTNYIFHMELWFKKIPREVEEDIITYSTAELISEFEKIDNN